MGVIDEKIENERLQKTKLQNGSVEKKCHSETKDAPKIF